jgi:hypothetical protein
MAKIKYKYMKLNKYSAENTKEIIFERKLKVKKVGSRF